MKKLLVVVFALSLGLATTVNAKMLPTVALKVPTNVMEAITDQLEYPKELTENFTEGYVAMKISMDENSNLQIVDLSATNPDLGVYVKEELTSLKIDKPGMKVGQVYFLKVKFDLVNK